MINLPVPFMKFSFYFARVHGLTRIIYKFGNVATHICGSKIEFLVAYDKTETVEIVLIYVEVDFL